MELPNDRYKLNDMRNTLDDAFNMLKYAEGKKNDLLEDC